MKKSIKIICASDSHGKHNQLKIPKCDLYIHAGDANITSFDRLFEFNKWLGEINAVKKIFVAGNHDCFLEEMDYDQACSLFTNATYLINNHCKFRGIKIFGSPFSKKFNNWSFMDYDERLNFYWDLIEKDTDVVITHGPAFGWLDLVGWQNQGSQTLRNRLEEIKPKLHITGHIHEEYGIVEKRNTTVINASALNENYKLTNEPIEFYYEK